MKADKAKAVIEGVSRQECIICRTVCLPYARTYTGRHICSGKCNKKWTDLDAREKSELHMR